jgi:hypothetical protein
MASVANRLLSRPALAAIVVLVVVAGVLGPRLVRSAGESSPADKSFAEVCRAHGGTASFAPGSGDYVKDARSCEITYGGDSYEMYAVRPEGFSQREAAQAHHACTLLAAQKRRDDAAGFEAGSTRVVWHPRSAICESQP